MSQAQRVDRLRREMRTRRLDAFFVSQPLNVYYLTGFRPTSWNIVQPADDPEGFLLVEQDRSTFICDGRYDPAIALAGGAEHAKIETPGGVKIIGEILAKRTAGRVKRMGYEPASLLHADAIELFKLVPGVEWAPAGELPGQQRLIKDAAEIELLKQAAKVTDGAYAHVLTQLRLGMTEHEVAEEINGYLRRNSDGCSFTTIVAFGQTAAAPHYEPSHERTLEKGHLILMDFGANYRGYMGDMTRMAVMGKADDKQKHVYALVLKAQQAALDGLRPDMTGNDADRLARDVFDKAGVLDKYLHGTGHGLGLAIHEPPRLKVGFDNKLACGTVFTIEPGLYEAGWGGVRIEDVVVMTETGPVNITGSPKKELIEVPC